MSGRKPKPTHLKLLDGENRKERLSKNEPKPDQGDLTPPDDLSKLAKKEWLRLVPTLYGLGIYTEIDRDALIMYCETYCQWKEANDIIVRKGVLVKQEDKKGNVYIAHNPAISIANKAKEQMLKIMAEFGMTASSRTKITVAGDSDDDEFESLLD